MAKVYVGKSKIAGEGMFVANDVKKGHRISFIKGKLKKKVNKGVSDSLANPDWIGFDKYLWIDPSMPYKKLNHCCSPNAGIKGKVSLYALTDIRAGEEVTIDYSITECDELWKLDGGKKCNCGSRECRKIIGPIQSLSQKKFKSYMPYIPTAFIHFYLDIYKKHA